MKVHPRFVVGKIWHADRYLMPFLLATGFIMALFGSEAALAASPGGACALARAPAEDFAMKIPFDVVDGRIYVKARVDGRGPFRFAVDTGASGWGRADASLVDALDLKERTSAMNSDGVRSARADTVHLDSLTLGGLSRKNLDVITRDYNSRMSSNAAFSGIIGRKFFADGLLVVDYPRHLLSFSRTLSLSPAMAHVLTYERAFRVPVMIDGVRTQGNLDTGANVNFVLPRTLFDRVSNAPLKQAGHGRLANSRIETRRAVIRGPVRMGAVSLSSVKVRVSDSYPELLVGAHALRHFIVMFDQRSRTVALCGHASSDHYTGAHP